MQINWIWLHVIIMLLNIACSGFGEISVSSKFNLLFLAPKQAMMAEFPDVKFFKVDVDANDVSCSCMHIQGE